MHDGPGDDLKFVERNGVAQHLIDMQRALGIRRDLGVVDPVITPPGTLDGIHGLVSMTQQRLRIDMIHRVDGDAHANADGDLVLVDLERRLE